MRYLKKFENYSSNATQVASSSNLYTELYGLIENKDEFERAVSKIPEVEKQKIGKFMKEIFGVDNPDFNYENAQKFQDKLKQTLSTTTFDDLNDELEDEIMIQSGSSKSDNVYEMKFNEGFKENENLAVKIIGRIKQALAINLYMGFGMPLAIIISGFAKGFYDLSIGEAGAIGQTVVILSWILYLLFSVIMKGFGYGNKYGAPHEIGPHKSEYDWHYGHGSNKKRGLDL